MKRLLLCAVFVPILSSGQVALPRLFTIYGSSSDSTVSGLQSNTIIEIKNQGDSLVWLGTGRGLSVMDTTEIRTFYTSASLIPGEEDVLVPYGGVSAISVASLSTSGTDTVIVAVATSEDGVSTGAGLALTFNPGDTTDVQWRYFSQPIDSSDDTTITWGDQTLQALPITVPQQNVTYDIAIGPSYYWITSWAGGLRRLSRWESDAEWGRVPLPMDDQSEFLCGDSLEEYDLNPRDPPQGQHNHKGFSVLAYGDTVWVGTANGINRGIVNADDITCIDWIHYSFPLSGITGNWVVGLAKQEWNGQRKIWAVTLRADQTGEQNGISYTEDDGETWFSVSQLRGERGYNIFCLDSLVYVATEKGLWKSEDGVNFALFQPAVDAENNDQILSNHVYAVLHDVRPYWGGPDPGSLWVGTGDGLARTPDPASSESIWKIYRYIDEETDYYAFPNPFSPLRDNLLDGDGYVRFRYNVQNSDLIKVDIYNFAMEKVVSFNYGRGEGEGTLKWDGRDSNGNLVANGVYFINLFYDNQNHWVKLIVVK